MLTRTTGDDARLGRSSRAVGAFRDSLGPARQLDRLDLLGALVVGSVITAAGASTGLVGGLVGLLAAAGLVVCLSRPPLLGYVLVVVVPITSGVARGIPVPGLRISEAVIVGAAVLVLGRTAGRSDRRWQALDWAAAVFVGLHLGLGMFNVVVISELVGGGAQVLVGPVQFFLLYRVVRATVETPDQRCWALRLLLLATIPVSLLAIAQFIGVPGVQPFIEQLTRSGVFDLWGYDRNPRATGPFESWHPLAGYLFLPMAVSVALLAQRNRNVLPGWLAAGTLALMTLALLVSLTLNVLVGLVLVIPLLAVLTKQYLRILVPVAAIGLLGMATFGPAIADRLESQGVSGSGTEGIAAPQTIDYRFEVWTEQYFPAIGEYWMTGYGPDLPASIEWRSTESLYITILLRGGVPLLAAYGALWFFVLKTSWRQRRSPEPVRRSIAVALIASGIALVPMQAVFPYFTASGLPQVWWVLVALVAGSSSSAVRHHHDEIAGRVGPDDGTRTPGSAAQLRDLRAAVARAGGRVETT